MSDTHKVVFNNLRSSQTGEVLEVEVPNDLVYEGKMLLAQELGRQAAEETLKRLKRK